MKGRLKLKKHSKEVLVKDKLPSNFEEIYFRVRKRRHYEQGWFAHTGFRVGDRYFASEYVTAWVSLSGWKNYE